jgi:uncharacterized protein YraI
MEYENMTTYTQSPALSRRDFMRKAATGAFGLAVAGTVASGALPKAAGAQEVSPLAVGPFRTTAALNLRKQPSLSGAVILVIPYQAQVEAIGPEQNGYINVSYNGNIGWAHGDYLTVSSGGDTPPVFVGTGKTTAALNLRSGAGLNYSVKRVIPSGATIELYDGVENNYRQVMYAGTFGWAYADYIATGGSQPTTLTTTAALNLRSQPSLAGSVLRVIPYGAQVQAGTEIENGYRKVTYAGTTGWSSTAFLR